MRSIVWEPFVAINFRTFIHELNACKSSEGLDGEELEVSHAAGEDGSNDGGVSWVRNDKSFQILRCSLGVFASLLKSVSCAPSKICIRR